MAAAEKDHQLGELYTPQGSGDAAAKKLHAKLWRIFPGYCASLIAIPYGMMLGWPSPTYTWMILPSSSLPITIDQSAMVAGFLMVGNVVGAPFSSTSFTRSKYCLLMSLAFTFIGWILMWCSNSIYWLLASRFFVGLGNGYGGGQMNRYIKQLYNAKTANRLGKIASLHVYLGIILSYCLGNIVSFWQHSVAAVIVTIVIFFVCVLIPNTVDVNEWKTNEVVMEMLNPNEKNNQSRNYENGVWTKRSKTLSFTGILRQPEMRKQFVIFVFLVFFQQFSGITATIVYNQVIFINSGYSNSTLYSVIYSLVYLVSNVFALFFLVDFNKKCRLLTSGITVSLLLALNIAILYYEVNRNKYWSYASFIVMIFYVCFHTVGLGTVPIAFAQVVFPKQASEIVGQFYLMFSSTLGLIITKIFQVLFDHYDLYVPFCLFLCISACSVLFVFLFLPSKFYRIELR